MADPGDLVKAWQDVIRQLRGAASPLTGVSEELVGRLLGPLNVVVDVLDESASAMRTQAQAFNAAGDAFKRAADVLEVQASLLQEAARSLRDPAHAVRAAGGVVSSGARRARPPATRKRK